jgi:TolB-like protein/DNA-binding SARP family transcriptional activator
MLRLGFLGDVRVERGDGRDLTPPGRKLPALLAYLVLHPARRHDRELLTGTFWADRAPEQGRHSLRQALHMLRRRLGTSGVDIDVGRHDVVLSLGQVRVDVWELEALGGKTDLEALERAAALYRGDLLEGLPMGDDSVADWCLPERARLRRLGLEVQHRLARRLGEAGQATRAIEWATRLLAREPAHEETHRLLMSLYADGGRRSEALRQFRECERALRERLDATPARETCELHAAIQAGRSIALRPATPPAPAGATRPGEESLLNRPAVAVLPFDNLGASDRDQYFADGVTEEVINLIAGWRWWPVLARGATFPYRRPAGVTRRRDALTPRDAARIGRELEARYLVTGSVRRAGERVRVTAQLVEAEGGRCLWSERYDGVLQDVFAFQDHIAQGIAARLEPELARAEEGRRGEAPDMAAHDFMLRGYWHHYRGEFARAEAALRQAIKRDPEYASAYALLATVRYMAAQIRRDGRFAAHLRESLRLAERALALDEREPRAWLMRGQVHAWLGEHDGALPALERALALSPSLGVASSALSFELAFLGRFEESEAALARAIRLRANDRGLGLCLPAMAIARYQREDYVGARAVADQAVAIQPRFWLGLQMLAASLGHVDPRQGRATAAAAARTLGERLTAEKFAGWTPYRDPAHRAHVAAGLRKAGLG